MPAGARVLVLDAETRQSLTVARSLGRAGVRVDAGVCRVHRDDAPALRSRWCEDWSVLPDLGADGSVFADALVELLDRRPVDVLFPMYDGSIEAIRSRRDGLERRVAVALAAEDALEIAVDKAKTLSLATRLGIAVPRSAAITSEADVALAVAEVGLPAVLKPDRSWCDGIRLTSIPVLSLEDAFREFDNLCRWGSKSVTIQQWLCGRRDAVTLMVHSGEIKACFAQTSLRELPRLGGVSVLCESIEPSDDITKPGQRLVLEMGLDGPSQVEFRRDAHGVPVLMEVNPRIGGSVGLAVACGVDIPAMVYAWATGRAVGQVAGYAVGRRLRWLTGDLWSLYSALNHDPGPDVPSPANAVREFMTDFLYPRVLSGTFDWSDPLPAWVEVRAAILKPVARRLTEAVRRTPSST